MPYGTIKVDTVTFTDSGVDKSVSISGLVQNPTFSGNVTVTGTISGVTVTGTTASFTSGNFTNISVGTYTITSGVFSAGSETNPSITFTGDLNTGIYSPGADQVAISTGGSGRLFVDASGNVGVGAAPATILDSTQSAAAAYSSWTIRNTASNGYAQQQFLVGTNGANGQASVSYAPGLFFAVGPTNNDTTTPIVFRNNNSQERLRITAAGLVGVGTSSPSTRLHVSSADASATYLRVENTGGYALFGVDGSGNAYAGAETNDAFGLVTNGSYRMYITAGGNVGVGTTSPSQLLTVYGGRILHDTQGTGGGIYIDSYGTNRGSITTPGVAGQLQINAADNLALATNSNERLRIDSSGRVGIGTSSPISLCHISGPEGTYGQLRIQATGAGEDAVVAFSTVSNGRGIYLDESDSNKLKIYPGAGKGAAGEVVIDNSGRVGIGTTTVNNGVLHVKSSGTSSQAGLAVEASANDSFLSITNNGSAHKLEASYNSTGSYQPISFVINGERARIDTSGRLLVGTSSTTRGGAGDITAQGSSAGASLRLQTSLASPADGDQLGNVFFADAGRIESAGIQAFRDGGTWTSGSSQPTRLVFSTTADGASSPTERMRIAQNGVITIQNGAVAVIGTLTDGATITPDFAADCNFTITLGGNRTIANPTNITAGQSGSIFIVQDATGSRTLSWGSSWDFPGGTAPTLSTAANAVDRIDYIVRSSTSIHTVFTANYS